MPLFRVALLLIWVALLYVTIIAIDKEGVAVAADVFSADLEAGSWRAQFNVDLLSHMAVLGMWIAWRYRWAVWGVATGLCCVFGGALFSAAYVLALSLYHRGDMEKVLMGRRYSPRQERSVGFAE